MFLRPEHGDSAIDAMHRERPGLTRTLLSRRLLALLIGGLGLLLRFALNAPDAVVWGVALGVGVPAWIGLEVLLHRRRREREREARGPDGT
jgi:hypothetical protein